MIVEQPKDFTMVYEENKVDVSSLVSEIDLIAMDTPDGLKALNQMAYEQALNQMKDKYKALETVYFFFNDRISSGIIRKVSVDITFNGDELILKQQTQIAMNDGTILNSPGDLNDFFYTKEELVNYNFDK